MEDQWKTATEMGAALHGASRLTTTCQNGSNLSDCYGPNMRKELHDGMSSSALSVIEADTWSENEMIVHPKRAPVNASLFVLVGEACLSRVILEIERRFFGRKKHDFCWE